MDMPKIELSEKDREALSELKIDEPMLRWFAYEHLPPHLQAVSSRFSELANWLVNAYPRTPERTVALRKLLESKDAAVRNALPDPGL